MSVTSNVSNNVMSVTHCPNSKNSGLTIVLLLINELRMLIEHILSIGWQKYVNIEHFYQRGVMSVTFSHKRAIKGKIRRREYRYLGLGTIYLSKLNCISKILMVSFNTIKLTGYLSIETLKKPFFVQKVSFMPIYAPLLRLHKCVRTDFFWYFQAVYHFKRYFKIIPSNSNSHGSRIMQSKWSHTLNNE